jgi:hypothetical protein
MAVSFSRVSIDSRSFSNSTRWGFLKATITSPPSKGRLILGKWPKQLGRRDLW